jgi:hypothetical protein
MSLVARVIRQFHEGADAVSLERLVGLPYMPTMGSRLALRAQGVDRPWRSWGSLSELTLRGLASSGPPPTSSPGPEPLAAVELAREGGWRDFRSDV